MPLGDGAHVELGEVVDGEGEALEERQVGSSLGPELADEGIKVAPLPFPVTDPAREN